MSGPMHPPAGGEPHARCGAMTRDGDPCVNPPMTGQTRCRMHGGSTPVARAAAERRVAEAEIERHLATLGERVATTPEEALQRQLEITAGHCAWLLGQVQQLSPEALVWSRASEQTVEASQFPGVDTTYEATSHALLVAYERHLKIHLSVVDMALKHNLSVRQVRLAEEQASVVVEVIRGSFAAMLARLSEMGLPGELASAWPALMASIVPQQLRAIGPEVSA